MVILGVFFLNHRLIKTKKEAIFSDWELVNEDKKKKKEEEGEKGEEKTGEKTEEEEGKGEEKGQEGEEGEKKEGKEEEEGKEKKEGGEESDKTSGDNNNNDNNETPNNNNDKDKDNNGNNNNPNSPFLYAINLVHTRKDRSKKRGATIRALAIFCRHKLFEMWGPLLSHLITHYFETEKRDTSEDFYQTINALDFSDIYGRFLNCYPFRRYCGGDGGGREGRVVEWGGEKLGVEARMDGRLGFCSVKELVLTFERDVMVLLYSVLQGLLFGNALCWMFVLVVIVIVLLVFFYS